ncbi:D-alanyl-D-alanine carboxypeptidase/D-alanyl-D-alanine-endopeptidase [Microbacterium aoyamense]|uniref:D-alanyl-D-alanine carboxypeptidase/D-alanyl-D-alanine-endopeptidase n=2 Tax=Microbacterium aoyamense TaxID=344166 RepID=A0ABN2PQ37_9MICO
MWSVAAVAALVGSLTACTFGTPEPEASDAAVPAAALEVMNQPQYANGRWLISVRDIATGDVLIDLGADQMAEPASFTKSYSVGAAWLKWGPDHVITTPVKSTGDITGPTMNGDLVLVGMGDITLGGRTKPDGTVDFADLDHNDANPIPGATLTTEDPLAGLDELAAQVKASGIDTVTGTVIVDDRLFQGELADEPITPIVVNQNLIDVLITPGEPGEPATVEMTPAVAPWHIVSTVETVAAGEDFEVSNPESTGGGALAVGGTIAADSDPVLKVYALEDPATFARTAFIEALARAGVTVGGDPIAENPAASLPSKDAVAALPAVAEFDSLPLSQQATYIMKISYNRGAQAYVCLLSVEAGEDDCSAGLEEVGRLWADAGLDITGMSLVDGSGLNGNYITPENGVAAQTIMAERPDADEWRATMPILGVDGSLATVQPDSPAAGKVFAKTGTLVEGDLVNGRLRLNTKALGGVMEAESGRELAFVIIMNQGFSDDIEGVFTSNDDVGAVAAAIQQSF